MEFSGMHLTKALTWWKAVILILLSWEKKTCCFAAQTFSDSVLRIRCDVNDLYFFSKIQLWLINVTIVEFAVADVDEIKWDTASFNCLAMPQDRKKVILTLAEAHMCDKILKKLEQNETTSIFDDFVSRKRQGLNILLQWVISILQMLKSLIYCLAGCQGWEKH